ncbi:MAG: hypothetical protein ACJ79P_20885 [Myxococcales bacterium]
MHRFHVPVMGIGFTIDSALRVAKLGISTVMSLADDRLIERVRRHYCEVYGLPCTPITAQDPDARANRIAAWLDLVDEVVTRQVAELNAEPLEPGTDKWRYVALLPDSSELKQKAMRGEKVFLPPGAIDVNIMTKVDGATYSPDGTQREAEHSLAKAALRGFARSRVAGSVVLSAGVNPSLFGYLEQFDEFHRDASGHLAKPIILKVSDVRSALIQGKFLAKKGVEIAEFRIESGLNCGGHVFPTDGELMGPILAEFQKERGNFAKLFDPLLEAWYASRGRTLPASARNRRILVTAQGGVGNHGEMRRLTEHYGVDLVGWATPFLLVPEVVLMDEATRDQLALATEDDLYVSNASPLGVKFNNLRGSSSERWHRQRVSDGTPGSPCPKELLASNTEFPGPRPLCTASAEYQEKKLQADGFAQPPQWDAAPHVYEKACICDHLGNSALLGLGISKKELPVAVCPGPNLAYFDRTYRLEEMVDHIYGRGESLVPADRPHMFAKELELYVDHCVQLEGKKFESFRDKLLQGIAHYRALATAYPGENIASLHAALDAQTARLAIHAAAAVRSVA